MNIEHTFEVPGRIPEATVTGLLASDRGDAKEGSIEGIGSFDKVRVSELRCCASPCSSQGPGGSADDELCLRGPSDRLGFRPN